MSLITENNALGNGSNPNFSFTFEYVKESDVYVSVNDVVQTLNTHYTFAPNTSSITFLPAHIPANGAAVRIYRITDVANPAAQFFPGSAIRAQDLNTNNDQVLFSAQERKERSLNTTGGSLTGQLDMQTNKIVNLGTPTADADASTKLYVDTQNGLAGGSAGQAAASAAAAATSETNAATSATNAATSASNAATSATNAAASETNAQGSANNAATSETNAAASATASATSETNAATSATSASGSATAAASSAAAAAAAFDNFDDVYLGEKTADPTVDNDGDPLNGGDLYYRSTAPVGMKVYTGSAWVAAYVPGDAANIISVAAGDLASTNVQDALNELDTEKVPRTSTTGSAKLPVGNTSQRDADGGTPANLTGYIRYNTQLTSFEGHNGTSWGAIGGGATGGGADAWALEHDNTVTTSYTIGTGKNVITAGPLTINSGATVTVPTGSTWVIV
tara:strand:- start:179 stop:1537 length:1359 start_codon:yes stop_codon:yes gene_type:complete